MKQDVVKEVERLLNILIERSDPEVGIRYKWQTVKRMMMFGMRFDKQIREFVRDVILELDTSKTKLDKDDWYFCLRRKSYCFRGMSFEARLKLAERIDQVKKHTRVQFYEKISHPNFYNGKVLPGVKITQTDGSVCLCVTNPALLANVNIPITSAGVTPPFFSSNANAPESTVTFNTA